MSRFFAYLNAAAAALTGYHGEMPLAPHLKAFFAQRKQMGSRDRKLVSALCYAYFRLGRYAQQLPLADRLLLAAHVPGTWPPDALEPLSADWQRLQASGVALPDGLLHQDWLFAPASWLSEGADSGALAKAMLQQPALFLRLRPGGSQPAIQWLRQRQVPYLQLSDETLQLPNGTKLDDFALNNWAVVQDASSQRTGNLLLEWLAANKLDIPGRVWDCCAASGGKSIMLLDKLPGIELAVSDIRTSVLHNLQQRFQAAGLAMPPSAVLDLAKQQPLPWKYPFDMVLADVPCSGSGTWGRTPEQAAFFREAQLQAFQQKQFSIAAHASTALKPGGLLLYITCSVFKAENEEVVNKLVAERGLVMLHQKLIDGTRQSADSMYVALLQAPAC